jgi:hypothetical protein
MREEGPFAKQISIRLNEDGTGFLYTVTYGWFRLPTRHIPVFEEGGKPIEVEMPAVTTRHIANNAARNTLPGEENK